MIWHFGRFLKTSSLLIDLQLMLIGNKSDDYQTDVNTHQSVPAYLDSISSISWSPPHLGNIIATTSWDGQLRILSIQQGQFGHSIFQQHSLRYSYPALKCCWNDQGNQMYVALLDGSINVLDFGSGETMEVGRHGTCINALHFVNGMNAVISTSNDQMAHIWQLGNQNPVQSIPAQNKILTSDFQYPMLVAGTAKQKLMMIDLSNQHSKANIQSTDLGKGSQIQSIAISQKGTMCAAASYDGRATVMSLIKNVSGVITPKSLITFKSNKADLGGVTTFYPINSICFNPRNEKWCMTGGSDGAMHFWDLQSRNKIKSLHFGGHPICVAKVSPNGGMLAYGLGDDWHLGSGGKGKWQVKLGVHIIGENEMKHSK